MKYCATCGKELNDNAVYCDRCGTQVDNRRRATDRYGNEIVKHDSALTLATKIFMIISCVVSACVVIPLAWCIPMTVSYWNAVEEGRPVSTAFKVCTLIFVNVIPGILMLCDND